MKEKVITISKFIDCLVEMVMGIKDPINITVKYKDVLNREVYGKMFVTLASEDNVFGPPNTLEESKYFQFKYYYCKWVIGNTLQYLKDTIDMYVFGYCNLLKVSVPIGIVSLIEKALIMKYKNSSPQNCISIGSLIYDAAYYPKEIESKIYINNEHVGYRFSTTIVRDNFHGHEIAQIEDSVISLNPWSDSHNNCCSLYIFNDRASCSEPIECEVLDIRRVYIKEVYELLEKFQIKY